MDRKTTFIKSYGAVNSPEPVLPLISISLLPRDDLALDPGHQRLVLPVSELSMTRIMSYTLLCVCALRLSITMMGCLLVAAYKYNIIYLFLIA